MELRITFETRSERQTNEIIIILKTLGYGFKCDEGKYRKGETIRVYPQAMQSKKLSVPLLRRCIRRAGNLSASDKKVLLYDLAIHG